MGLSEYVVVDIETTGLSRFYHRITEIGAVKVKDGAVTEEFQTLVNPGVRIPSFITRLTGITDGMVADADPIERALPRFLSFLGECTIVAHNATFDYGFLAENASRHLDHTLANARLCTKKLATRLLPELPSKRLSALCSHFDLSNEAAHRALGDARVTQTIFSHFLSMLSERGIDDEDAIFSFERTPPSRLLATGQLRPILS